MVDQILPPPRPQRSMMIKGLTPSLPERGKIKIGRKGSTIKSAKGTEFQPPQKMDHFTVTGLDRDQTGNFTRDEAIHQLIGDKPTEIQIRLLYDDPALNFPTRYASYAGRSLWCTGDGEEATRLTADGKSTERVQCPCHRKEFGYSGNDKCKMNGSLAMLLDGISGIGGVHKFRTTSYNSVVGILSSLSFIRSITGGPLAGLPLTLTIRPKQVTDPSGRSQTVYVVGIEFRGDLTALQTAGHQIALNRATTHLSIERIEDEARQLLLAAPSGVPLPGDINDDVVDEFYPADTPPRPQRSDFTEQNVHQNTAVQDRPSPPMTPPQADAKVEDSAATKFAIVDADGCVGEFDTVSETCRNLCLILGRAALDGRKDLFDGIWESNDVFLEQVSANDPESYAKLVEFHRVQALKVQPINDQMPDFGDDDPLALPAGYEGG